MEFYKKYSFESKTFHVFHFCIRMLTKFGVSLMFCRFRRELSQQKYKDSYKHNKLTGKQIDKLSNEILTNCLHTAISLVLKYFLKEQILILQIFLTVADPKK